MKPRSLAAFFADVGPYLHGRRGHAETVRALWGAAPPPRDAERLAIYARFCRTHRFEVIEQIYLACRRAAIATLGAPRWDALVEEFFVAHPMRHVELNENGALFAAFLVEQPDVPRWLVELADLEWWEWRTRIAPDGPDDRDTGAPLRLASTVELRPYEHALVAWLDDFAEAERPAAPEARAEIVLFWRDRDLDPRRETASTLELAALKLIVEGAPLPPALDETVADLRAAGILYA